MDPVKLDEIRKKRRAELSAQLEELKSEVKKLMEERSLPGAKVTAGVLSEMEKSELRKAYSNREPLIARFKSQEDPCWTASSPRDFVMIPG